MFYSTFSLYIADKFYTFVMFCILGKTGLSEIMMKRLNNLKSINQLSSI